MAAGEVLQEELLPAVKQQRHQDQAGAGAGGEGPARRRCWQRAVCQGEHGRSPLPEEGGPQDVQGLPRAQGGPGGHVPRLLRRRRRRAGRQPLRLRRHLRGQGRRPHARRRRALRHVHQHLQEVEDHEGIRGKRPGVSEEQLRLQDACVLCVSRFFCSFWVGISKAWTSVLPCISPCLARSSTNTTSYHGMKRGKRLQHREEKWEHGRRRGSFVHQRACMRGCVVTLFLFSSSFSLLLGVSNTKGVEVRVDISMCVCTKPKIITFKLYLPVLGYYYCKRRGKQGCFLFSPL